MEEIWKDIEGYEGYYKINENGNIMSMYRETIGKNGGFYKNNTSLIYA